MDEEEQDLDDEEEEFDDDLRMTRIKGYSS